jgi:hypothetical protein
VLPERRGARPPTSTPCRASEAHADACRRCATQRGPFTAASCRRPISHEGLHSAEAHALVLGRPVSRCAVYKDGRAGARLSSDQKTRTARALAREPATQFARGSVAAAVRAAMKAPRGSTYVPG